MIIDIIFAPCQRKKYYRYFNESWFFMIYQVIFIEILLKKGEQEARPQANMFNFYRY